MTDKKSIAEIIKHHKKIIQFGIANDLIKIDKDRLKKIKYKIKI